MSARSDYQDEVGWPQLARDVERQAHGADVVLTRNYGEAGALELFGHGLPPVASGQVTFRYWRPPVGGQRAVLVGFTPGEASFCRGAALSERRLRSRRPAWSAGPNQLTRLSVTSTAISGASDLVV